MGNFMKGVSDGRLIESEAKILGYSGLNFDHFKIDNIVIDTDGNYIRTIQIGIPPDGVILTRQLIIIRCIVPSVCFCTVMEPQAPSSSRS